MFTILAINDVRLYITRSVGLISYDAEKYRFNFSGRGSIQVSLSIYIYIDIFIGLHKL